MGANITSDMRRACWLLAKCLGSNDGLLIRCCKHRHNARLVIEREDRRPILVPRHLREDRSTEHETFAGDRNLRTERITAPLAPSALKPVCCLHRKLRL